MGAVTARVGSVRGQAVLVTLTTAVAGAVLWAVVDRRVSPGHAWGPASAVVAAAYVTGAGLLLPLGGWGLLQTLLHWQEPRRHAWSGCSWVRTLWVSGLVLAGVLLAAGGWVVATGR